MLSEYQVDCITLNNVMTDQEDLQYLEQLRQDLREVGAWPPDRGRDGE